MLTILDGKDHRRGRYERFVGDMTVHFLNGGSHWGVLEWIGIAVDAKAMVHANSVFLTTLRQLVDQFIETGIDADGIENPSNRRVRASVGEPQIPIFDTLLSWLNRNMPRPALNNDGTISILEMMPQPHGRDPEEYAREMAIYHFEELLDSPARIRIARCKNPGCQRYYERKRSRKSDIKRGTYCGECRLIGNAERTKLSRQRRKEQLLEVAAKAWNQWETARRRAARVKWVATQVNRAFPRLPPIYPKWVNQNKQHILSIAATDRD